MARFKESPGPATLQHIPGLPASRFALPWPAANVGDHYFQVHTEANYRDLDVAAGGPVVREISGVFDRFWNGHWSVPIGALVDRPATQADLQQARTTLRERIAADDYPYPIDQDAAEFKSILRIIDVQ
ncbi:hypothetical protein [Thiocystis violacea]|uniref:hypothetical protein n=1 Tax=Thiocystis violacea TaxID=13725 RepID=UPI001905BDB3|nr:hypothetical protein [Thiocystis violacea]MBK1719150.1 hypothetical protein [Thiocystis violacea]